MAAHPGFKKAAASIQAKEGVSEDAADRILAAGARKASPAAKKANPRLNRVGGADPDGSREEQEQKAKPTKQYAKGAPGFHAFFKDYMKQPGL